MKESRRSEFGKRLLAARRHAKLTQVEVAKAVGIAQGTLAAAEKEASASKFTPQLAKVLGVRADWLATGDGPMVESVTWPFRRIDIARVLRLTDVDLSFVEGKLESAVEKCELEAPSRSTQQHTDEWIPAKTGGPVQKHSATLDGLSREADLASSQHEGVRKQRRSGDPKRTPRGR